MKSDSAFRTEPVADFDNPLLGSRRAPNTTKRDNNRMAGRIGLHGACYVRWFRVFTIAITAIAIIIVFGLVVMVQSDGDGKGLSANINSWNNTGLGTHTESGASAANRSKDYNKSGNSEPDLNNKMAGNQIPNFQTVSNQTFKPKEELVGYYFAESMVEAQGMLNANKKVQANVILNQVYHLP